MWSSSCPRGRHSPRSPSEYPLGERRSRSALHNDRLGITVALPGGVSDGRGERGGLGDEDGDGELPACDGFRLAIVVETTIVNAS